jgi:two-component system KDP operon response regulator KdpE
MKNILIIDDDVSLCDASSLSLSLNNFNVTTAFNAKDGLDKLNLLNTDLLLLDLGLPDMDGKELLKKIREFDKLLRVIVITARSAEFEQISSLRHFADEYLIKPFTDALLHAYIDKVFNHQIISPNSRNFSCDNLFIDFDTKTVKINKEIIYLTAIEFNILEYLVLNKSKVKSCKEISRHVGIDNNYNFKDSIKVEISRLRKKIEKVPHNPQYIITVHNQGYYFNYQNN